MPVVPGHFPRSLYAFATALLFAACAVHPAGAQTAPLLARHAADLGRQRPAAPVSGTVWLPLHNKAALDAAVEAMYTPGSPAFHRFFGPDDLKQFAPTAAEIATVTKELRAHHLAVAKVDAKNYSIKFAGQSSDFEAAFHTVVNRYRMKNGTEVSGLLSEPTLANEAAPLLKGVTGIAGPGMQPFVRRRTDPLTGQARAAVPLAAVQKPQGAFFSAQCFYQPQTVQLGMANMPGAVTATYTGLIYGAPVANTAAGTLAPCGYAPQDIYKLYRLDTAYGQGYQGKGVTIAIVDGYGSPTIQSDLEAFDTLYNLPAPGSFTSVQTTPFTATDADSALETTLDVEWAHAIAPAANILLVTTPTLNDDDLQSAVMSIVEDKVAAIISNSYGAGELSETTQSAAVWNQILELAAAEGIAANFASGDDGDYASVEDGQTDVSLPASSPYATAVGGTSLALSPFDGVYLVQSGWGDNAAVLAANNSVFDPPLFQGFQGGSGGGTSQFFPLPSFEASLGGTGRKLPDVAALADPMTGVEIVYTQGGTTYVELVGGTSLATPIFSSEWALLTERFGFALGQAAPYIAQAAGTQAIDDMVPPPEAALVTGTITTSAGTTTLTADSLSQRQTDTPYQTAMELLGGGNVALYTFAADSSLALANGWDPVTGWGVLDMNNIFTALANVK